MALDRCTFPILKPVSFTSVFQAKLTFRRELSKGRMGRSFDASLRSPNLAG